MVSDIVTDHVKTGEKCRAWRLDSRVSLRDTAKALGKSAAYISDLELGKRNWDSHRLASFIWAVNFMKK